MGRWGDVGPSVVTGLLLGGAVGSRRTSVHSGGVFCFFCCQWLAETGRRGEGGEGAGAEPSKGECF